MKILNKKLIYILAAFIVIGTGVYIYYKITNNQPYTSPPIINPTNTPNNNTGTKTYRNTDYGFEFQYPSDWIILESPYGSGSGKLNVSLKPPKDDAYRISINVLTQQPSFLTSLVEKGAKVSDIIVDDVHGKKYNNELATIPSTIITFPLGENWMVLNGQKQYEIIFNQIVTTIKFFPKITSSQNLLKAKIYSNTQFGFEFQYPDDWTFEENYFYSPVSKFNLEVIPVKGSYYGLNPIIVNIVTPNFVERSFYGLNGVDVTVAGVAGKKYEYEFEGIQEISIIIPLEEYKMILGVEKPYEDIFNQILASFKFLK